MSSIAVDLRKKNDVELKNIVSDLKAKLLHLRFKASNGETDKLHTMKEIRKTIARALTILNERALSNEKGDIK
ncbi:50S ribosomal protein L29 [Ureaplasma canigenitalium]|uniref:50S ribosomal protein L29 n=1 Tax=Ureaplasma canigenitalium TaxID=42092 RepID=UPI0004E1821B|nr:50S ribosomal protein L29 [Ureaplasma canigenitalium]